MSFGFTCGTISGTSGSILKKLELSTTIEPKAMGGPVAAGTPYIVGERGPELFVPGAAGGIVPGMGGGMTMVVNNNQVNQSSTTNNQQHSNISIVDEQQERVGL